MFFEIGLVLEEYDAGDIKCIIGMLIVTDSGAEAVYPHLLEEGNNALNDVCMNTGDIKCRCSPCAYNDILVCSYRVRLGYSILEVSDINLLLACNRLLRLVVIFDCKVVVCGKVDVCSLVVVTVDNNGTFLGIVGVGSYLNNYLAVKFNAVFNNTGISVCNDTVCIAAEVKRFYIGRFNTDSPLCFVNNIECGNVYYRTCGLNRITARTLPAEELCVLKVEGIFRKCKLFAFLDLFNEILTLGIRIYLAEADGGLCIGSGFFL